MMLPSSQVPSTAWIAASAASRVAKVMYAEAVGPPCDPCPLRPWPAP
jgi:hypothetical protein